MGEKLFMGIDPGQTGGLGIVGQAGQFIACHRWDKKDPISLYNIILRYKDMVVGVYLEDVNMPQAPGAGINNQFAASGNLFVNLGIWIGWMMALDLHYVLIPPATWQAAQGLHRWKKLAASNPAAPSPLTRARQFWPAAPLEFQADDGKAVGLLLADFARRDFIAGIDRGAIRQAVQVKTKIKKKAARAARKAQKDLTDCPW